MQAWDEQCEAAARALVLDGCLDGPFGADEDDFALGPGNGRIEEVALEHDGVAVDQDHDDRVVFTALALVDGNGIGQGDFIDFLAFVFDILFGIADIDHVLLDGKDFTHIAVEDAFFIVVVLLHDLIADAEDDVLPFQFGLPFSRRVEPFLDELIEVIYATGVLIHRRQDLDGELIARFQ